MRDKVENDGTVASSLDSYRVAFCRVGKLRSAPQAASAGFQSMTANVEARSFVSRPAFGNMWSSNPSLARASLLNESRSVMVRVTALPHTAGPDLHDPFLCYILQAATLLFEDTRWNRRI